MRRSWPCSLLGLLVFLRRLLELSAPRLGQVGLHARRDQRRERPVARGVGLVVRLGCAEPEPGLLGRAQLLPPALVELRAQAAVGGIHAFLRALQAADLALAHRRGALGLFAL